MLSIFTIMPSQHGKALYKAQIAWQTDPFPCHLSTPISCYSRLLGRKRRKKKRTYICPAAAYFISFTSVSSLRRRNDAKYTDYFNPIIAFQINNYKARSVTGWLNINLEEVPRVYNLKKNQIIWPKLQTSGRMKTLFIISRVSKSCQSFLQLINARTAMGNRR